MEEAFLLQKLAHLSWDLEISRTTGTLHASPMNAKVDRSMMTKTTCQMSDMPTEAGSGTYPKGLLSRVAYSLVHIVVAGDDGWHGGRGSMTSRGWYEKLGSLVEDLFESHGFNHLDEWHCLYGMGCSVLLE